MLSVIVGHGSWILGRCRCYGFGHRGCDGLPSFSVVLAVGNRCLARRGFCLSAGDGSTVLRKDARMRPYGGSDGGGGGGGALSSQGIAAGGAESGGGSDPADARLWGVARRAESTHQRGTPADCADRVAVARSRGEAQGRRDLPDLRGCRRRRGLESSVRRGEEPARRRGLADRPARGGLVLQALSPRARRPPLHRSALPRLDQGCRGPETAQPAAGDPGADPAPHAPGAHRRALGAPGLPHPGGLVRRRQQDDRRQPRDRLWSHGASGAERRRRRAVARLWDGEPSLRLHAGRAGRRPLA
eukprot:m.353797 g.353797  ORF g.353797 m.353797 type:complete len:301 (-) comp16593_c2_seq34:1936-2838(-)